MGDTLPAGVTHDLRRAEGGQTLHAVGFMTTAEHRAQFYVHQLIIHRSEISFIQREKMVHELSAF